MQDLYWAAGFLEGEGCFATDKTKSPKTRVSAHQVNPEPLERLLAMFGGRLRFEIRNKPASDIWVWTVNGSCARGVMMTLYSLLSKRRQQQVRIALSGWSDVHWGRASGSFTQKPFG